MGERPAIACRLRGLLIFVRQNRRSHLAAGNRLRGRRIGLHVGDKGSMRSMHTELVRPNLINGLNANAEIGPMDLAILRKLRVTHLATLTGTAKPMP